MSAQRILNHIAAAFAAGHTAVVLTMDELDAGFGGFSDATNDALVELMRTDAYWETYVVMPVLLTDEDDQPSLYWITAAHTVEGAWKAALPLIQTTLTLTDPSERDDLLDMINEFRESVLEMEPEADLPLIALTPTQH